MTFKLSVEFAVRQVIFSIRVNESLSEIYHIETFHSVFCSVDICEFFYESIKYVLFVSSLLLGI